MNPFDQFEKIIPPRYVPYFLFLCLVWPSVTKAIATLRRGHGLIGVVRDILWGDPKPQEVVKLAESTDTQMFAKPPAPETPKSV